MKLISAKSGDICGAQCYKGTLYGAEVLTSGAISTYLIGKNNKYFIIYDINHTTNKGIIKDFKNSPNDRKSVGPTSFSDLFSAKKWKEFFNGK